MAERRIVSGRALCRAAVTAGLVLMLATEAAGAWSALSRAGGLIIVMLTLVAASMMLKGHHPLQLLAEQWRDSKAASWVVVGLTALPFLTGLLAPPNGWDSLTYHLPRVEHWATQGNLDFWATSVDRQLWMAPWAGYAMLALRLLTGSDRLSFLPSWLAYVGCVLLTASLARRLGADRKTAALAAILAAAAPVAILQASSAQTDLAAAFWVLITASLALDAWQETHQNFDWKEAGWVGAAAALAVATKGTAWMAVAPWLGLYLVAAFRWRKAASLRSAAIIAGAVLTLNFSAFLRNLELFGSPLGDPQAQQSLRLMPLTVGGAAANSLANLSLHLGTPSPTVNETLATGISWIQEEVLRADTAKLFPFFGGFQIPGFSTHESLAGNPVHLIGLAMALLALIWNRRAPTPAISAWLWTGLLALGLHLVLVRWQLYGARLQLGAMIWIPALLVVAVNRKWVPFIGAAAVLVAAPSVFHNSLRPLLGPQSIWTTPRFEQYFKERPALLPPLRRVADDLAAAQCSDFGIVGGYDTPEYLLIKSLEHRGVVGKARYLDPPSRSAALAPTNQVEAPCAVIILAPPPSFTLSIDMSQYSKQWIMGEVGLLLRD